MKKILATVAMIAALAGAGSADAAYSLVEWNLAGKSGNEVSDAATLAAANVTGEALTRGGGLTASAAANSFSASGWTGQATDYFQFGFTVASGYKANILDLYIGTRSSNTGPGEPPSHGSHHSAKGSRHPLRQRRHYEARIKTSPSPVVTRSPW